MKWTVTACWLSQKSWHMTEWGRVMLSHSVLRWFIADTINTETGTTGNVEFFYYKLEYFTEFYLFQAWTWRVTLQIYVTLWGRWFVRVCVRVCVCVYFELLSHFLPFKIHLTNISPILIKMVDFKNLAWATSFATRASRKFIYSSGQVGKKVIVIPWTTCDSDDHINNLW